MRRRHSPDRPAERSPNATYAYCLVHARRMPSMRGVPGSVPGADAPRLIAIDRDIWAVVADAPLARFAGDAIQQELQDVEGISRHAVAHASVIEFVFRRGTVIPLKLFTLFSSDEKLIAHVRSRLPAIRRMFSTLRGLEEWGVRIFAGEVEADTARTLDSGRDYLQLKKRLHTLAPSRPTQRAVNGALRSLGRIATKTRKDTFPPPARGRPYVTGASFLVKATQRASWKAEAARVAASLAGDGHRFDMSGPWPPYHFVSK